MKKSLLFFALINSILMFSQEFEGLGVFKLGKFTTSQLDSLAVSKKMTLKECDDYSCSTSSSFVKLLPSKLETYKSPSYSSYSENVKVYQLNGYKLNDKYNNRTTILSFYKDLLYSISISSPDTKLIDDLELKYGDGELGKREDTDKCRLGGQSFELPSATYSKTWKNSAKNFSMLYLLMSGYNSDCEERILTSVSVYDKTVREIADKESSSARNSFTEKMNSAKKKTLNDL